MLISWNVIQFSEYIFDIVNLLGGILDFPHIAVETRPVIYRGKRRYSEKKQNGFN